MEMFLAGLDWIIIWFKQINFKLKFQYSNLVWDRFVYLCSDNIDLFDKIVNSLTVLNDNL